MNTKLLILVAWASYFALLSTSDDFWRFLSIYAAVMATCAIFYNRENKSTAKKKKKA